LDWKSRASRRLGTWLEPKAVNAADAIVAVSQGTIDGIVERIPAAARLPHGAIPLGFEPADFAALRARPEGTRLFDVADGFVHLCYVGTVLPTGAGTVRLLLRGLARARRDDPAALRLRLHFIGTSNQSDSNVHRVMPIAHECGVSDVVTEMPGRLDYVDALRVLVDASAILLLGSSERHYTASKLFPALLAKRPILALFNEASSVVSILRAAGSEPSVRIVTYGDGEAGDDRVGEAACHLRALAASAAYDDGDVSIDRIAGTSARRLAHQLAAVFNQVAA
jgi:glycosyltransferase involved in cell wall biosynthesis